jgi:hypothetical protein
MKKLLIITNLFWLFIFVFFSCTRNGGLQINSKDCQTFCYNYSAVPFPGLSRLVADTISHNYRSQIGARGLTIENDTSETRAVWFKLETIKNFIYQVERSTCQLNCDSIKKDELGIRFYFAKYPKSTDAAASQPDFAFLRTSPRNYGKKTLFMVPTYYVPGIGDKDFDPRWSMNNDRKTCKPLTLSQILDNKNNNTTARMITGSMPEPDGMQNHGMLCPKICDGAAF